MKYVVKKVRNWYVNIYFESVFLRYIIVLFVGVIIVLIFVIYFNKNCVILDIY